MPSDLEAPVGHLPPTTVGRTPAMADDDEGTNPPLANALRALGHPSFAITFGPLPRPASTAQEAWNLRPLPDDRGAGIAWRSKPSQKRSL